jgi:hypothetical protein
VDIEKLKADVEAANAALAKGEVPSVSVSEGETPEKAAIAAIKETKALKPWTLALIALPVLFYFNSMRTENADLRSQLADKSQALVQMTKNYDTISDAIDRQNSAIERASSLAAKSVNQANALSKAMNAKRLASEAAVHQILIGAKPKTCEEARQFLIDGVKDLQW